MRNPIASFLAVAVIALLAAPTASAKEYYRGCLVGTHDNYMLRADDGQLYRLHSHSQDDFRAHLGDVVEIKGQLSDHERERDAQDRLTRVRGSEERRHRYRSGACPGNLADDDHHRPERFANHHDDYYWRCAATIGWRADG